MTRKRIIVEGPDGSGKSTLIDELLRYFPGQLELHEGFNHSQEDDYQKWLTKELFPPVEYKRVPVHNRFFYSELIYGPILRGSIQLTPSQVRATELFLREEAFLIYCSLSYEDLVKSATENSQMEGVMPNLRKLYHAYDDLMAEEMNYYWPEGRCTSYSYDRDKLTNIMTMVGDYLKR